MGRNRARRKWQGAGRGAGKRVRRTDDWIHRGRSRRAARIIMNSVFRVRISCRESHRNARGSGSRLVQFLDMLMLAIIFMKRNGLSVSWRNALITYLPENKADNPLLAPRSKKTPGGKMKASAIMLLKTNEGKTRFPA